MVKKLVKNPFDKDKSDGFFTSHIKKAVRQSPAYKASLKMRDAARWLKGKKIKEEVPANAMGGSSSTEGPIRTFDPLLKRAKKATKLLRRQTDASRHNKTTR